MDPINPIAGNPDALNQNPNPKISSDNHWISILAMAIFVIFSGKGKAALDFLENLRKFGG